MKDDKLLNKKIWFLAIFSLMILVGKNINFSAVIGMDNQFFTVYQLFGPIASGFLGTTVGVISVLIAELASFLMLGKSWELINLLRLTPMLFGAYYFGNKKRLKSAVIPVICMILFITHPVGREAWMFSLYWLIPIISKAVPNKVRGRLLMQSFGATFTAHAVGSVIWLYTIPMTSAQWLALIPIVALERLFFGTGIAGAYVVINTGLGYLAEKLAIKQEVLNIEREYQINKQLEAIAVAIKSK